MIDMVNRIRHYSLLFVIILTSLFVGWLTSLVFNVTAIDAAILYLIANLSTTYTLRELGY